MVHGAERNSQCRTRTGKREAGTRRDFLILATAAVGAVGRGLLAWPLHRPDEPVRRRAGARPRPRSIWRRSQVGQAITVKWRGKPVFIRHRTAEEIKAAAIGRSRRAARSADRCRRACRSPNG